MKFWTDTKEKGEKVKHHIRDLAKKEKPVALSDVMEGFGHIPDPDTYNKIFDNEEILKKMRLREMKSGWFLYLPEPSNYSGCGPTACSKVKFDSEKYIDSIVDEFKKLIEIISVGSYFGYFYRPCIVKAKKSGRKEERQDRNARFHRWADLSKGVRQVVALVEFDDGHMEQVQPDRIIFCKEEEE